MVTTLKDEQPKNVIAICTPSSNGLFSKNATLAHGGLGMPLNTSIVRLIVEGKPVDVARNELVELAKQHKAKYLLFLDDDTLPPVHTVLRLLGLLQKHKKTGKKAKVASGIYYTKSVPPMSVILKKNIPGGYEDWEFGDIFDVDYIGMGCCLIDMTLFDELEKPYFNFHKGSPDPNEYQGTIGEDVWFCDKVAQLGYKIWVDSAVQCEHEDFANRISYFYWPETGTGAWRDQNGVIRYFPVAVDPTRPKPRVDAVAGKRVCWGYGGAVPQGFEEAMTVDASQLREKYKDIKEAMVKDLLEFVPQEEGVRFLTRMVRLLEKGAKATIEVPDSAAIARSITEGSDEQFLERMFGPSNKRYKTFFTKKGLEETASLSGLLKTEIISEGEKLVLTGYK